MDNKEKSPKFSDVLGALITSVAHGRNVADVEALHIGQNYYKNKLLRGIPVPRLRIERVSISLPLMLSDVIMGRPAVANKPEEIVKEVSEAFVKTIEEKKESLETLNKILKSSNIISVKEEEQKKIDSFGKFLDIWNNKKWDLIGKNKTGISIFEEELHKQIINYISELKFEEGIEPSDISIIDTTTEAVEDTLVQVMSNAYLFLQKEEEFLQKEEEYKKRKEEIDRINEERENRKKRVEKALDAGEIDPETAEELIKFDEIVCDKAQWDNAILNLLKCKKITDEVADELKDEIPCEGAVCSYGPNEEEEIKEKSEQIIKYDDDWVKKELKNIIEAEYQNQLISKVRHAAKKAAIKSKTVNPDLRVVVNTENIKNAGGGPEVVTRLNIVLHEEGLEWLSEKHDGKETTKLMPE